MSKEVTFQIPFEGFYNSIHDSWIDHALEGINEDDSGETLERIGIDNVEWAAVRLAYAQAYVKAVAQEAGVEMSFHKIISPKDYSLGNDRIIAMMTETDFTALVEQTLSSEQGRSEWAKTVWDALTERPGYIPFTYTYSPVAEEWGHPSRWDDAQRDCFMVHTLSPRINEPGIAEDIYSKVDEWIWENVIDPDKVPGHVDNSLEA